MSRMICNMKPRLWGNNGDVNGDNGTRSKRLWNSRHCLEYFRFVLHLWQQM